MKCILQVLPGAVILIVHVEAALICKTDEVGEIVVSSPATASAYWGLPGLTAATFKVPVHKLAVFRTRIRIKKDSPDLEPHGKMRFRIRAVPVDLEKYKCKYRYQLGFSFLFNSIPFKKFIKVPGRKNNSQKHK